MYCPYCGVDHGEEVEYSIEHIVPFAMGGSNSFTISTCKASNNNLGSDVDAPFQDFFAIRAKRLFLGLKSTSGNEPSFDLGGIGTIDGKDVPISYLIQSDTRQLKIAEPTIEKTKNPDGTERWQVSGDPGRVREIVEGKLLKQLRLGKPLTADDGRVLQLEDLESLFAASETIIESPSITKTIHFDFTMPVRFFSKLALAVGHFHLGEEFSRSPFADRLRQHMAVTDYSKVQLSGGIWPDTDSIQAMLQIIAKPDHHTLAILDGSPRVFLASLFGEYGAMILLGDLPEGQQAPNASSGTVWRIALPSRQLRVMDMNDLIAEYAAELQRSAKQADY